ncbi:30S ribosomal protein THX [Chryseobacterium paridis]|uniref:30S ribosomal protein THX n=1 Tax=Chryseobacterium paridis TaxID=2800328 RepID=A0ABS1G0Z0_9FLAO|nr:30S ribosomal protein THX [Chryseobacterium paridis]MBK1898144.1 30S ribosomal protein THX [Chryseobacterium paridis]
MGKGDKKSRRGKINNGSYGKRRPRKASKLIAASEEKSKK